MFDTCKQTREFALIEAIAAALARSWASRSRNSPASGTPPRPAKSIVRSGSWPGPSSVRSPLLTKICRRS
jgi:hypothetical protein